MINASDRILESAYILACFRFINRARRENIVIKLEKNHVNAFSKLKLQESKEIIDCFLEVEKQYSEIIIEKTKAYEILALGGNK